ncbi:MAG: c-type cytochrome [Candidatus Poribacteria bacterium]|nr:c-type cytochrome [Candidatus Poribacteria bacterium]
MRSKKEIPVEEKSYSTLFFLLSGLLGLVTLWGFFDETVTRRPWKEIQRKFYQYEYEKTKIELKKAKQDLPGMSAPQDIELKRESELKREIEKQKIKLDEALQDRKFVQSEADAINYKYQHTLHEAHGSEKDDSVQKWKGKLDELEGQIEGELTDAVLDVGLNLSDAYGGLADFYETSEHHEKALAEYVLAQKYNSADTALTGKISDLRAKVNEAQADQAKYAAVARIQEKLDDVSGIKRTFLGTLAESPFTNTRSLVQYYLQDFDYTADRCATCHFATDKSGYERYAKKTFEIEGDGENKPSYQLMHPFVKVGSETVLVDEYDAEEGDYVLSENGVITFNDPDIFAEVEISYETGYDPVLRTHPHRDVLLAKHPAERFGCTPCHGGQGQALTAKAAHALTHKEYWLTPALGLDEQTGKSSEKLRGYMQSNCRRCHDGVMMLDYPDPATGESRDYSPDLSKGMALFEDLGCHGCHAVDGYSALDNIDKVGPSLAKIGSKVKDVNWIEDWIKKPAAYLPDTKMPSFFPNPELTQVVYLRNGNVHTGVVTRTGDGIILQKGDGTEYSYPNSVVDKVVDEVKSIAAYLAQMKDPTIDQAAASYTTAPEAIAAGEEIVKTVGCLACHAVDGLGSDFAPKLDSVGNKVTPSFLRQWISDPKAYDPDTVMPNLRLTDPEVENAVAYLMSLQSPTSSPIVDTGNSGAEVDPAEGEKLLRTYGCFGCHNIPGFENESKVGVDLGEFGAKIVEELDFGDTVDIEHSWHGWTIGKVTNPRGYQTRRIIPRMPVFPIDKEDARVLAVLLKSFQPQPYPASYMHQLSEKTQQIDTGRRLAKKYNCTGCHQIEGKGGQFVDVIAAHEGPDLLDPKRFAPPTLQAEGARVYPYWLFEFLKHPTPIRYGLKVRMPTFGFADEEATALVKYFSALSDEPFPYETIALQPAMREELRTGKEIFEALQCTSCHPEQGEDIPAGSDKAGRPDLSLAKQRLKADWIIEWLKDPGAFQPGTAMPQNWPKIGGEHLPVEGYADNDAEKQIQLVRDYMLSLGE